MICLNGEMYIDNECLDPSRRTVFEYLDFFANWFGVSTNNIVMG